MTHLRTAQIGLGVPDLKTKVNDTGENDFGPFTVRDLPSLVLLLPN